MNNLKQRLRFVSDAIQCGPLYAIANDRIHSPVPLDPYENWDFWTEQKPDWLVALMRAYPPKAMRKVYLAKKLAQSHASGIEAHYDVSNDFYALFLDSRYRFYTCAEFLDERETLEEAQTHKANYLRQLLDLDGYEKILDLGCGWGSMLKYLQERGHKGELSGFTLSKEQFAYDRETLGLDVSLADFITAPLERSTYDRIYSIGALEHVRPAELQMLYKKIYDALVPEGLAVHQFFSFKREAYPISALLVQLFFPGSNLSLHRKHLEFAQAAGFKITHDSVHDYKPTIRAWYDRLVSKQKEAIDMVGLAIYNRYATFLPFAWLFFQQKEAALHRVVMRK